MENQPNQVAAGISGQASPGQLALRATSDRLRGSGTSLAPPVAQQTLQSSPAGTKHSLVDSAPSGSDPVPFRQSHRRIQVHTTVTAKRRNAATHAHALTSDPCTVQP